MSTKTLAKVFLLLSLSCYCGLLIAQEQIDVKVPDVAVKYVRQADLAMKLWPGTPPGGIPEGMKAEEWVPGKEPKPIIRVNNVSIPTLGLFKAKQPNGTCVVIFPGGGYNILAFNHEGTEIATWLNSLGITAVVVKYRVPRRENQLKHMPALQDAQRAIRLVRSHAKDWKINPDKIGVLGFSAGGHLTVMASTQYNTEVYKPVDAIDKISARPDFAIPIYPAYMMDDEKEYKSSVPLSSEIVIDSKTPPMFTSVAGDDVNRAAAAARLFIRMREAKVPMELHILVKGGHGYGLRADRGMAAPWDVPCEKWFKARGLIPSEEAAK
ncbi:MAG: alpha/beta hydrolase [Planctomycetia bacterium]|nr:alpha/beta hydrolase [Planctomycetia bacterium]